MSLVWRRLLPFLVMAPGVTLMGLLFLGPLLQAAQLSVSSSQGLTLARYVRFLRTGYSWDLLFTLGVSLAAALLCAVLSLPIAFAMVRKFRGKWLATTVILLPVVVPHIIGAYALWLSMLRNGPIFALLSRLNLLTDAPDLVNDWKGLLIALVWKFFPVTSLATTATLANLDPDLVEAARDIGAGWLRRMQEIVLPLLMPGLLSGTVLVFVMATAQFSITLVVYTATKTTTIPLGIYHQTFGLNDWEFGSTLGIVLTAVTLIMSAALTVVIRRTYREAMNGN
jgi:ABC-type spermidine/putrescine transport system permease subunit I